MTPILLLHGALGSQSQLVALQNQLVDKGREVFTMNFSGHSGEPFANSNFGIKTFAEDVVRFCDRHELRQVDIFGYSMGGYVALWLASQAPHRVRHIVTLGTKFDWTPELAEKEVKKMNPDSIVEKIPAFARILESRHAPNSWRELMYKTALMMTELGARPLLSENEFKQIHHPVVVALGDRDDMADRVFSEHVARWLPRGKFLLLGNTPHPIEKADINKLSGLFDA